MEPYSTTSFIRIAYASKVEFSNGVKFGGSVLAAIDYRRLSLMFIRQKKEFAIPHTYKAASPTKIVTRSLIDHSAIGPVL